MIFQFVYPSTSTLLLLAQDKLGAHPRTRHITIVSVHPGVVVTSLWGKIDAGVRCDRVGPHFDKVLN